MINERSDNQTFVLTSCTYFVGTDIKPGRYSVKLLSGTLGNLHVNRKYLAHIWFGSEYEKFCDNLRLELGATLTITGDIKLLFTRKDSVNIEEDISIIEQQQKEIQELKNQLRQLKETIKNASNEPLPKQYILSYGSYYGGQTIRVGVYDMKMISGDGYIIENGIYHKIGTGENEHIIVHGIKVSSRTKIQITNNLVVEATFIA